MTLTEIKYLNLSNWNIIYDVIQPNQVNYFISKHFSRITIFKVISIYILVQIKTKRKKIFFLGRQRKRIKERITLLIM